MKAYVFDGLPGDQREPHDSGRSISFDQLERLGVLPRQGQNQSQVDAIAKERGYKCRDEIMVSKAGLGEAYEAKIKGFFEEHLHEDEEIRWIREGCGYFDVRDSTDEEWIRIKVEPADLIVYRPVFTIAYFTLDHTNFVRAVRLFQKHRNGRL